MDFQCVCGKVLSMAVEPGAVVQCPACGQMIQVPWPASAYGPAGPQPSVPGGAPGMPASLFAAAPRTCGMATAALILGIIAVIFGPFTGIPAIILGAIALSKVGKSQGQLAGSGMAVAGLATGIVFSILNCVLGAAILLPAFFRAREMARQVACANNLRNISLATFQYAERYGGQMPGADQNLCLLLGQYVGEWSESDAREQVWRCPNDDFIPRDQEPYWCSYAPNASVEETDEVIGGLSSNHRLRNGIASVAPDTILFVEMWTPPEVVPGHPGFMMRGRASEPEDLARSMVEPGRELCAIRSYTTSRPAEFDGSGRLVDPGNYLFLRAFVGKRIREMYHRGRMNVAFADGHVEVVPIETLIRTDRPADNSMWTRAAD